MLVQLFKLLSAEGVRQLSSRSGRKINTIILVLSLKKRPRPYMIQCQWCQLPVESSKSTNFATLPCTEEELPDRPQPDPEGPETTPSEANKELRWSVGPQRKTGAS